MPLMNCTFPLLNHAKVCTTTPCQLRGAQEVYEAVGRHLGLAKGESTTSDHVYTLEEVECAGACVNAPIMAINDVYYVG